MTPKKPYTKIIDRYGTVYRCSTCYARSGDENYIKGQMCHNPLIKTDAVTVKNVEPKRIFQSEPNYAFMNRDELEKNTVQKQLNRKLQKEMDKQARKKKHKAHNKSAIFAIANGYTNVWQPQ